MSAWNVRADGSLLVHAAMSMARVSGGTCSADATETTRLVQLTLGGDFAAFEQFILRHEHRIVGLAARLLGAREDAEDVAQEVFLRAFKYLHRLDVQKPIEPWLMRIAVNVCRDAARLRQRRLATFVYVEEPDCMDVAADPYTDLARKQEHLILQKALESLPEKERLAIALRDVEGLSTSEVASILQSSETTVRSQISRGRLKLKEAIDRLTGARS